MDKHDYFNNEIYTGNHLHVDNWKDEFTPFIEAVAWERQDSSMDLFFYDFADDNEFQVLANDKENYHDEYRGVFLGNVKTDEEAYELFLKWIAEVIYPFRNGAK
ncbi:MAG: hypothetical protein ACQEWV_28305 [Bacillota bacterium]